MKEILLVGIGGMFGSIARYLSSAYFLTAYPSSKFPLGTFFVNLLGCLLIGILAGATEKSFQLSSEIRLAGIAGFLGGFTTFSAFGIETLALIKEGSIFLAAVYVLGSVLVGVVLAYLGLKIAAP